MKKAFFLFLFMILFSYRLQATTLIGYWDFEESGSTILDQSGFGNNGQLTGATTHAPGKVGNALSFDGSGGVLISNSPSLDSLPGGFTMEAWINATAYPDFTTIFWKTDRNNRIHMLHFQVDGRLYAAMNHEKSAGGFEGIASNTVELDEWHFVTWVYDDVTERLYDNGVEVFSEAFSQPWAGNDIDLQIGYHPEINSANFRGKIDEARIYSGALTQEEILRDMNGASAIPEPATLFLFGAGFLTMLFLEKINKRTCFLFFPLSLMPHLDLRSKYAQAILRKDVS